MMSTREYVVRGREGVGEGFMKIVERRIIERNGHGKRKRKFQHSVKLEANSLREGFYTWMIWMVERNRF